MCLCPVIILASTSIEQTSPANVSDSTAAASSASTHSSSSTFGPEPLPPTNPPEDLDCEMPNWAKREKNPSCNYNGKKMLVCY